MTTEMMPLAEAVQVLRTGRTTEAVLDAMLDRLSVRRDQIVGDQPEVAAERTIINRAIDQLESLQEELSWIR